MKHMLKDGEKVFLHELLSTFLQRYKLDRPTRRLLKKIIDKLGQKVVDLNTKELELLLGLCQLSIRMSEGAVKDLDNAPWYVKILTWKKRQRTYTHLNRIIATQQVIVEKMALEKKAYGTTT